jgi:hypothetical protein
MKLTRVRIDDFGGSPAATHNYPCPVCTLKHAVYRIGEARFDPCWGCQGDGWRVFRVPRWLRRWL